MKRLDFIRLSGYSVTSLFLVGTSTFLNACRKMGMGNMMMGQLVLVTEGSFSEVLTMPDIVGNTSSLTAQKASCKIAGIGNVNGLGYQAQKLLGPTIKINSGETVNINFDNQLDDSTNIHWHGLKIPSNMDGHPDNKIQSGNSFKYNYTVDQRAGLYFYHPHAMGTTAKQVFQGLAGFFIVNDVEEQALNLPSGSKELLCVIQDKRIEGGNIVYSPSMTDQMTGLMGQFVLVNGSYSPVQMVETSKYRIRILNGSNARIYNIALSDSSSFSVIGNDGGLLSSPESVNQVLLAPGERLDLIIDFSNLSLNDEVYLISREFSGGDSQGKQKFRIMKFKADMVVTDKFKLPALLSTIPPLTESMSTKTRFFDISNKDANMSHSRMIHTINSKEYSSSRIDETVKNSTIETWVFDNSKGLEPHPMHLHGATFQILSRTGGRGNLMPWEKGWKDVALCMPGETVKVIVQFGKFNGMYVFHCHNLEHEDSGMMAQYEIQ